MFLPAPNINPQDNDGNTLLHEAAGYDEVAAMKYLVLNGADVNARDHNGDTPMYHAYSREAKVWLRANGGSGMRRATRRIDRGTTTQHQSGVAHVETAISGGYTMTLALPLNLHRIRQCVTAMTALLMAPFGGTSARLNCSSRLCARGPTSGSGPKWTIMFPRARGTLLTRVPALLTCGHPIGLHSGVVLLCHDQLTYPEHGPGGFANVY